eukprot:3807480-Pyramimonas_sp.AAC.2
MTAMTCPPAKKNLPPGHTSSRFLVPWAPGIGFHGRLLSHCPGDPGDSDDSVLRKGDLIFLWPNVMTTSTLRQYDNCEGNRAVISSCVLCGLCGAALGPWGLGLCTSHPIPSYPPDPPAQQSSSPPALQ